jgi:hypothetical protein
LGYSKDQIVAFADDKSIMERSMQIEEKATEIHQDNSTQDQFHGNKNYGLVKKIFNP